MPERAPERPASVAEGERKDSTPPRPWPLPAVAGLVAVVAFLPSLAAGFVYDDVPLIERNVHAHALSALLRGFHTHLWDVSSYGEGAAELRYYRPLVTASYVLDWAWSGGGAWAFHLVNTALHAAATVLATVLATRWTGSRGLGFLVGLVFALHPTRTESVIWISGRTDLLMTLFAFAAAECSARSLDAGGPSRARAFGVAAVVSGVLAVLAKEGGVVVPVLLLASWNDAREAPETRRRLLGQVFLLLAAGVGYLVARAVSYPLRPSGGDRLTPLHGLVSVWGYLERALVPWPQTFFVHPIELDGGKLLYPPARVVLGVVTLLAFVGLLVHAARKDRGALALLGVAALSLAPLSNFTSGGPSLAPADHFLYLPLFAVTVALARLGGARLDPLALRPFAAVVLLVYAAADVLRSADYADDRTLFRRELSLIPENPVALSALSRIAAEEGDVETAYQEAVLAVAPRARRFVRLAGSAESTSVMDARVLALEMATTADGDPVALKRQFLGLHEVLVTEGAGPRRKLLELPAILRRIGSNGFYAAVAADTLLAASRLGALAEGSTWLRDLPDGILFQVPNPLNLVLAYARLGDYGHARRLVSDLRRAPLSARTLAPEGAVRALEARLDRAEHLVRPGQKLDSDEHRVERATGLAELGAYLRALRVLRPLVTRTPPVPGVAPLYVELLLTARLEHEALRTASEFLGAERAAPAVEAMRSRLSPKVLALRAPPEPATWWTSSEAEPVKAGPAP